MLPIHAALTAGREAIMIEWARALRAALTGRRDADHAFKALNTGAAELFNALQAGLAGVDVIGADLYDSDRFADTRKRLAQVTAAHAREGLTPLDTAQFVGALKTAIAKSIDVSRLEGLNALIDRMAYASLAAYSSARDEIIKRQSAAMLEMSTPALNLWDGLVLMPLVGVIDTARAQQIMETLLDAVVRFEAKVALLDITGVPVVDTGVARHLTLTVKAVQLLGASVILTGISPETAQTLVKLDVDLTGMTTRGSLRAGLKEGLRQVQCRIVATG